MGRMIRFLKGPLILMKVRLNKYLAEQGVASRRQADVLISKGLISVNGHTVTELGTKVDPEADEVTLHDEVIERQNRLVYFVLNKPEGYVTSAKATRLEPKVVVDLVKVKERVFPIGRLDKDTTGLLLLTNDGTLTYKLTHPSSNCEKEYEVRVDGVVTKGAMEKLEKGVKLWGARTKPAKVRKLGPRSMSIVITEGKNRQIRRICQKVGLPVKKLRRVRIKNLKMGNLAIGKWRALTDAEVVDLKS